VVLLAISKPRSENAAAYDYEVQPLEERAFNARLRAAIRRYRLHVSASTERLIIGARSCRVPAVRPMLRGDVRRTLRRRADDAAYGVVDGAACAPSSGTAAAAPGRRRSALRALLR
jgi:DNA-binding response OmpR family regulator